MATTTLPTQEQVDRVAQVLAPDVVHVRMNIDTDWADCPALYFKVVISDDASRDERLGEVTNRVRETFKTQLDLYSLEPFPYFNFRNQSEQAKLKEPAWD